MILAQLAYWMMKNNYVEVETKEAVRSVKRSISGMSILDSANVEKKIFLHLLERCGILRETERGKIDFIHRTFQEYLTAYEICRQEDWGYIQEKIGDTVWQETIVMCIGYAKRRIASKLIRYTLNQAKAVEINRKYLFLAITFLKGAVEVDGALRHEIEGEISKLIPPKLCECQSFVDVGNLAVQYLKCMEEYNHEERLACLRILRMIGSNEALETSKTYFQQVLTEDELREIGLFYRQFTKSELLENGIPTFVKEYIKKYCGDSVLIHCEMMKALNYLKHQDIVDLSQKEIINLKIIDYSDYPNLEWKPIWRNIKKLSLYGNFASTNIIKTFCKLQCLTVCSLNISFSIYDLNLYKNLYNITNCRVISSSKEYITGRDLDFLKRCECLEIILLKNESELFIEDFMYLPHLRKLTIGAEFALDFNYNNLPEYVTELSLFVSKDQIEYAKRNANELSFYRGLKVHLHNFTILIENLLKKEYL